MSTSTAPPAAMLPQTPTKLRVNDDAAEKKKRRKRRRTFNIQAALLNSPLKKGKENAEAPKAAAVKAKNAKNDGPPMLSDNQLADLYANCLQLSAENKINQRNTWELNLIDYIDELVDEDETNFTKASCTIDASIKIYSYRVDSVHTHTYKVLGGLANDNAEAEPTNDSQAAGAGLEDDEDAYDEGRAKRSTAKRAAPTLEANLNNINVKTFDLQFDVDPLFQKTSADFDKGGARGLLLNNLDITRTGALAFDSNCVLVPRQAANVVCEADPIDIGALAALVSSDLPALEVCPAFTRFVASEWESGHAADNDGEPDFADFGVTAPYGGDDLSDDGLGFDSDDFDADALFGVDAVDTVNDVGTAPADRAMMDVFAEDNTKASAVDAVIRMARQGGSSFSFFSPSKMKGGNWAGPQHWKFRKPGFAAAARNRTKGEKKPQFVLNFGSLPDLGDNPDLAPATKSTVLAQTTINRNAKQNNLLPPDVHYELRQLTRFALRPRFVVLHSMVRDTQGAAHADSSIDEGVADDWYDYDNDNDNDYVAAVPAAASAEGFFGGALIDEPRKVSRIPIQYERKTAKVNVGSLKRGIWSALTEDDPVQALETHAEPKTAIPADKGTRHFSQVLEALPKIVPKTVDEGANVSFAFICLLHLANESSLRITTSDDMRDLVIEQDVQDPHEFH